jgi:hypothetical protein
MRHRLIPLVLVTLFTGNASGALLFYDSFNYNDGSLGVVGAPTWVKNGTSPDPTVVNVGGLTHPGLLVSSDTKSLQYDGSGVNQGSGAPTAGMVYKLVARADGDDPAAPLRAVAKKSLGGKLSVGGAKWAARRVDATGTAEAEVIGTGRMPPELTGGQLLVDLMRGGETVAREHLDTARERHIRVRATLPLPATQLSHGEPVLPTQYA